MGNSSCLRSKEFFSLIISLVLITTFPIFAYFIFASFNPKQRCHSITFPNSLLASTQNEVLVGLKRVNKNKTKKDHKIKHQHWKTMLLNHMTFLQFRGKRRMYIFKLFYTHKISCLWNIMLGLNFFFFYCKVWIF